jgi:hypothetical protein
MNATFAIYPDGQTHPSAFFTDLEDATEWALEKYGSDRFCIKFCSFAAPDEVHASAN